MGIQIKKFQAPTLQRAIEMVREELGDNAIILQTETVRNPKALGLLHSNTIEVTAAIDRKAGIPRVFEREETPLKPESKDSKFSLKGFFQKGSQKPETAKPIASVAKPQVSADTVATRTTASNDFVANQVPSVGQFYAMKSYVEPLQREIDILKAEITKKSQQEKKSKVKDPLQAELQALRSDFSNFLNEKRYESMRLPAFCQKVMEYWQSKGMTSQQILRLFRQMENMGAAFESTTEDSQVAGAVEHFFNHVVTEGASTRKKGPRIVVLVGPTGVGKTTSIAKMAAHEKLKLNRSVALVTLDDFKVGGSDQLAQYARILEVPFTKYRPDLTLEAQLEVTKADTIFIDTFGVSSREDERMGRLKKILHFANPENLAKLEIHLALPVNIPALDVTDSLSKFADLKPGFLIFTKWDETQNWGGMLTSIIESKKPVSYICHGQNVPDDISVFSKKHFIDLVTSAESSEN